MRFNIRSLYMNKNTYINRLASHNSVVNSTRDDYLIALLTRILCRVKTVDEIMQTTRHR